MHLQLHDIDHKVFSTLESMHVTGANVQFAPHGDKNERERGHLAQIQACAFENEILRSEPNGVQLCKQTIQSSEITPLSLFYNSFIVVAGFTVFY